MDGLEQPVTAGPEGWCLWPPQTTALTCTHPPDTQLKINKKKKVLINIKMSLSTRLVQKDLWPEGYSSPTADKKAHADVAKCKCNKNGSS